MHKTAITVSDWKAFIFMQSVTSWQNFSAQTLRFEHYCETNAPPHTSDSGSKVRPAVVASFLPHWSGRSLILESHWTLHTKMQLFTDASGSDGWGAYWSGRWLQDHWSPAQQQMDIAWKELYATVMAVHTWGSLWQRQKILFHCDNQTVVNIWEKGNTKSPDIMVLVRLLYFCAARYHIYICVQHIPDIQYC